MKKYLLVIALLIATSLKAQRNDNIWMVGYQYCQNCPIGTLDFTYGQPNVGAVYAPYNPRFCISDSIGTFQFFTNGTHVVNKFGQEMINSEDFNLDSTTGNPVQGALILPFPDHQDQYYIFHVAGRYYGWQNFLQPCRLAYSTVDMQANGGAGEMILKNQTAVADTLIYTTLQAVKHGNGRDWWVVSHRANSNGMTAVLLTSDSITAIVRSNTGPIIREGLFIGQSNFSTDGNLYAIAAWDSSQVIIYNFDRCNGTFTFFSKISHPFIDQSLLNLGSCAFSPNNRYLYASDVMNVYQYDMYASDIPASEKIVSPNNGFSGNFYRFSNAPDGKIYMNSWGSTQALHVINDPNRADTACHLVPNQFPVLYYANSVPDFPNYRLGALTSSGCDTLTNSIESERQRASVYVYPNPSKSLFYFDVSAEKISEIVITDLTGRKIINLIKTNEIDLKDFPEGVYFYLIKTLDGKYFKGPLLKCE